MDLPSIMDNAALEAAAATLTRPRYSYMHPLESAALTLLRSSSIYL
jgi:hypothetical protein